MIAGKMNITLIAASLLIANLQLAAQTVPFEHHRRAATFDSYKGVRYSDEVVEGGKWGSVVLDCDGGDWFAYHAIDFADGIYDTLIITYSKKDGWGAGGFEVRLNGPDGQLLKKVTTKVTHCCFKYKDIPDTTLLSNITGVHDIYIVLTGGTNICRFELFWLKGAIAIRPEDAKDYYVATDGNDNNDGLSIDKPFKTIQKAASVMRPGSNCYIRKGIYRETVRPSYTGTAALPLKFEPYNNERVVISGAEPLTNWSVHKGSIYKAPMSWDLGLGINQVYVDGTAMLDARTPNADLKIGKWTDEYARTMGTGSGEDMFNVTLKYMNIHQSKGDGKAGASIGYSKVGVAEKEFDKPDGFFNGALFRCVGGWLPAMGIVTNSRRNNGSQVFDIDYHTWLGSFGFGFVCGTLNLLDNPREFAMKDNTMYLQLPGNANPEDHLVEAKKRTLAFDLTGKSHVTLKNLHVFAASITLRNAHNCTIDGLHGRYISHYFLWTFFNYTPHLDWPGRNTSSGFAGIYMGGTSNTIKNSTIAHSAGSGIIIQGDNVTVSNCHINHCNYVASYDAAVAFSKGEKSKIEYCDMHTLGRGGINNCPQTVYMNKIHNTMFFSGEGGGIYTSTPNKEWIGTEVSYNWFYDNFGTNSAGMVADNFITVMWRVHHNVFWFGNNGGYRNLCNICGDRVVDQYFNNTFIDSAKNDTEPYHVFEPPNNLFYFQGGQNKWKLTDVENYNFVPMEGSAAIDAGIKEIPETYYYVLDGGKRVKGSDGRYLLDKNAPGIPGVTITDYAGSAPDLGAYEHGKERWIPGPTYAEPKWVYPPDGSSAVNSSKSAALSRLKSSLKMTVLPKRLMIRTPYSIACKVKIVNALGATVADNSYVKGGYHTIPLHNLSSGLYMVRLSAGGATKVRKFIKR